MKIINEEPKQKDSIKTMKVKGRKSKLTTELIEKISAEIENGSYQKVAARKCGVGESTFYAWMEKAEGGVGGQFKELLESVKNASAVAVICLHEKKPILLGKSKRVKRKFQGSSMLPVDIVKYW